MAKGQISVFNLGEEGVNLVKSPVHRKPGELLKGQNAIFNPDGEEGGLQKRGGLPKLNSVALAGAVKALKAIPLPDPENLTSTLYAAIGPQDMGTTRTWRKSTDGATWANTTTPTLHQSLLTGVGIHNQRLVSYKGRIYYAADPTGNNPQIRVFDGATDYLFVEVPDNPTSGGSHPIGITDMIVNAGTIYFGVYDPGGAAPSLKGRVFSLDPATGALTEIGNRFGNGSGENTNGMPFSLCWYLGRLWAGTYGIGGASAGKVYNILPGVEETWTLDHTTTVSQGYILSMAVYQGSLFAGTYGDATVDALVLKRTASGVWSTSDTASTHVGGSSYQSLIVYNSKLYAVFEDPGAAGDNVVREFNGSAWSTVSDIYADFGGSSDKGHAGQPVVFDDVMYLPLVWTSSTLGAIRKILKNNAGVWSAVDTLTADGFRGPIGAVTVET